jgi:hypothetical protein
MPFSQKTARVEDITAEVVALAKKDAGMGNRTVMSSKYVQDVQRQCSGYIYTTFTCGNDESGGHRTHTATVKRVRVADRENWPTTAVTAILLTTINTTSDDSGDDSDVEVCGWEMTLREATNVARTRDEVQTPQRGARRKKRRTTSGIDTDTCATDEGSPSLESPPLPTRAMVMPMEDEEDDEDEEEEEEDVEGGLNGSSAMAVDQGAGAGAVEERPRAWPGLDIQAAYFGRTTFESTGTAEGGDPRTVEPVLLDGTIRYHLELERGTTYNGVLCTIKTEHDLRELVLTNIILRKRKAKILEATLGKGGDLFVANFDKIWLR